MLLIIIIVIACIYFLPLLYIRIANAIKERNLRTQNIKTFSRGKLLQEKKPKVLLIDNNEFQIAMYSLKLRQDGAEVVGFSNVDDDIVQKVLAVEPDIICTDVLFPSGRTGFDAVEILKNDERTRNIPVVFLSNMSERKDIEKAKQLGVVEYIVKANHEPQEVADILLKICIPNRIK